jgi:2-hydroxychromene-2-carboxylate isomerase
MQLPAAHPFNPLGLLRLALACGEGGLVNRYVAEAVFRHAWRGGADAVDAQRLADLRAQLQPRRDPAGEDVKAELKANTDEAIARGVFGVPTYEVDGRIFWGFDGLPILREYLDGNPWFASGAWEQSAALPVGKTRS